MVIKTYISLTKPGIIAGNLITAFGGFALASQGNIRYLLLSMMLIGLGFVIASACVWNNYIDRNIDQKMERTRKRPLASGAIDPFHAKLFASFLGAVGVFILAYFTSWMALITALVGLFVYVVLYSFWKKSRSYATLVGSVAGAVPIVVGYSAVTGSLTGAAWLLFALMVLWQMPHFFAIALYRVEDYTAASIPVLPVVKGPSTTCLQMMFYVAAFGVLSPFLSFLGYTGTLCGVFMTGASVIWFYLACQGFKSKDLQKWARKMFLFSLIIVTMLSVLISVDFPKV